MAAMSRQGAPNPLETRSKPTGAASWKAIAVVTAIVVAVVAVLVIRAALD
jgi:hypothetical protein